MAAARKPCVMVVDDEPSVLMTYQMILEQQGYQVVAVGSAVEAKRVVAEQAAGLDLLLCDLSLEQRHTGFEVIEAAKEKHPALPSVLLTGYASADIAAQAEKRGVRVLFKPIDIQEFLSTISELLREKHERQKANSQ